MSLDELAKIAFRQGCGISLEYARRTPRFAQLHAEATALGLPEPYYSALAELLGERLADRAFLNLPKRIRDCAAQWHQSDASAQMATLELICTALRTKKWRRKGRETSCYNTDVRCVLPHSTKSWQRGRILPNCLGVTHMIVGFARAAGASHFSGSAIRTYQQEILWWEVKCLRAMLEWDRRFPTKNHHMQLMTRKLRKAYKAALRRTREQQRAPAHHVLVIQLADGSWWVLDPYLGALYSLGDNLGRDEMLPQLAQLRNRTLLVPRQETSLPYMYKLDCRLQALRFMYWFMMERFGPEKRYDGNILYILAAAVAQTELHEPTGYEAHFAKTLIEASEKPGKDSALERLIGYVTKYAVMPEKPDERVPSLIDRTKNNEVLHQRFAWRLIAMFLQSFTKELDELYSERTTRKHDCLEIVWPATMLGVFTLNHLRLHMPVRLGGVLSMLSSSQWVLADNLAAQHEGDPIAPQYREHIGSQLARLRGKDVRLLIPQFQFWQPRLQEPTGGNS